MDILEIKKCKSITKYAMINSEHVVLVFGCIVDDSDATLHIGTKDHISGTETFNKSIFSLSRICKFGELIKFKKSCDNLHPDLFRDVLAIGEYLETTNG